MQLKAKGNGVMACVTNSCNQCGHNWSGLQKDCPKCKSEDCFQEFDEEGDHPPKGLRGAVLREWRDE